MDRLGVGVELAVVRCGKRLILLPPSRLTTKRHPEFLGLSDLRTSPLSSRSENWTARGELLTTLLPERPANTRQTATLARAFPLPRLPLRPLTGS